MKFCLSFVVSVVLIVEVQTLCRFPQCWSNLIFKFRKNLNFEISPETCNSKVGQIFRLREHSSIMSASFSYFQPLKPPFASIVSQG